MMTASHHAELIARARAVEGGHLSIGRGGFSLHFGPGAHLSGYDCENIKAACVAAGLPVIDSRAAPFDRVAEIAISGPLIAVGEAPSPEPWGGFSRAPLAYVAGLYRSAGAEIVNLPDLPQSRRAANGGSPVESNPRDD